MLIHLSNISKIYGKNESKKIALNNINLTISKGEMIAIMGKSGCGKSTLVNVIGGLTLPTSGEYVYNNDKLILTNKKMSQFRNKKIGFIVQNYALINNRTVYENISIAQDKEYKEDVYRIAKKLGIYELLEKFPNEISGGESQRVAISRALINKPELLLADEPTGALDNESENTVMKIIRTIVSNGTTALVVTHDNDVANKCDRILYMSEGRITT